MKIMRVRGCSECLRLVAEFSRATLGRFKLEAQYKLAAVRKDDPEKIQEFCRRMETAEEIRQQARVELRQHEDQAHPKS